MSDSPPPILQYKSPTDRITTRERTNACRSLSALGSFCIVVGALIAFAGSMTSSTAVGGSGMSVALAIYFGSIALAILGLGVTYWVCSMKIKRFSSHAVTVALIVSGIHLALACLYLFFGVIQFARERVSGLLLILPLLFVAGLAELSWNLLKLRRDVN